jgi:hypothetical protein
MRWPLAIAIGLVAFTLVAASAHAADTRAEWVAQVDPICQNGQAQEAVAAAPLARATRRVKKHRNRKTAKRLDRAFGVYFATYANIERAVNAQIATVPPAPDDVSLVQVWLRSRNELLDLESRLFLGPTNPGKGLKGLGRLFSDLFEVIGKEYEVSDIVRDFGFQYCSAPPPEIQFIP